MINSKVIHDEETVVSREDHRHAACHWQTLSHDEKTVVSREHHRHGDVL
jgi:hypothetical protein